MLKKMLMLSLLSCLFATQVYADSPNLYNCKGDNVSLSFNPYGFTDSNGFPTSIYLNLKIGSQSYAAKKATIETSKSVVGDVKSITIKFLPDVSIKKASFILPAINLGPDFTGTYIDRVSFKSQLILTTIATPFTPIPYVGVINKSSYIDLTCTAALVFFPV